MIDTTYRQPVRDGRYVIVGMSDGYRIIEKWGSCRMFKKKFRTTAAASKWAESLP